MPRDAPPILEAPVRSFEPGGVVVKNLPALVDRDDPQSSL
jgi:hypothetical protein